MVTKQPTRIKLRIIQSARKNFAKKGFSNTSMDDISNTAKVSKGGLYHHFASKEDLFIAIFIENQDSVIKSQPKLFEKYYSQPTSRLSHGFRWHSKIVS